MLQKMLKTLTLTSIIFILVSSEILTKSQKGIIPQRPPNDKRQYEVLTLSNQMKKLKRVYLASQQMLGAYTILQHLLGLLTFWNICFSWVLKNILFRNSGRENAYTSDTLTLYYLQVKNKAFAEGVDRLTDFFVSPLLNREVIERQKQVVHNQFSIYTSDDFWREMQLLSSLGSPPYSQFFIGNNQTLGNENVYQDLLTYFNKYYSSNIMNAVLYSKMPIMEMKKAFIPILQIIPNRNTILPKFGEHYTKKQRGKFVRMQSIKDQIYMKFIWITQLLNPLYRYKIDLYITKVLCYKGKGSLFLFLKQKQYVLDVLCEIQDIQTQATVQFRLRLTKLGLQNYMQVYETVENYVKSLKAQKAIYNELKQINIIKFLFQQKELPLSYSNYLSTIMYYVPQNQLLVKKILFQNFQQAEPVLKRFLGQLISQNLIVILSAKQQLKNPKVEPYFGARYTLQSLPQVTSSSILWQIPPNPYFPVNTTLLKFQNKVQPEKIYDNFYLLQDSSFKIPKGGIEIRMYSRQTPQFEEFVSYYLQEFMEEIVESARQLEAEVRYSSDFSIRIFGFRDTAVKLARNFMIKLDNLKKGQGKPAAFKIALQKMTAFYKNKPSERQDKYATDIFNAIITNNTKQIQGILKQLEKYTYENVIERIKRMLEGIVIKWVAVGNFDKEQLIKLVDSYQQKAPKNKIPELKKTMFIDTNITYTLQLKSKEIGTSCTYIYYQFGPYTQKLYYKLLLIKNYADGPFFNEFRSVKPIAYLLTVKIDNNRGILGLKFILISSSHDPQKISDEIKSFLDKFFGGFVADLRKGNSQGFIKLRQSVLTTLLQPHKNLNALFEYVANQISLKTFFFRGKQLSDISNILSNINVEDLQQTWQRAKKVSLQIHLVSEVHSAAYKQSQKQNIYTQIDKLKQDNKNYWRDMLYCCNP